MRKSLFIILSILLSSISYAQIKSNGIPVSFTETLSREVPTIEIPAPNSIALEEEDKEDAMKGKPYRYAVLLDCDIDPSKDGLWETMDNGNKIWRLNIRSEGAQALGLYYDAFWIPSNGELYIYNSDKTKLLGAYTNANNHESGVFANEIIEDSEITLEYIQKGEGQPIIHINQVSYAYRSIKTTRDINNFGDSGSCEVNVNCSPEGDDWQDIKRAVCRISLKIGNNNFWCSGSFINNTAEDCKPYILTADHCTYDDDNNVYASQNDMNQWVFYFNYEASECENPSSSPSSNTMTGCSKISNSSATGNISGTSDFHLLELNDTPPYDYGLFAAGWDRTTTPSANGVGIHHPAGDIKKISKYTQSASSSGYDWRVKWTGTENGHGVTEGGSSGSPLLNANKQIVGDLSTGSSYCAFTNGSDFYGKFSYSWNQNGNSSNRQLKPWLDPNNSGVTTLDGKVCGTTLFSNFVASHTHVLTGYATQFSYTGTGSPDTYEWLFYGAGVSPTSSDEESPIVTYSNDGNYTVRLKVTEAGDESSELKSAYILVNSEGSSIGVEEFKQSLNIFPNPSNGIVYISQDNSDLTHVKVYTLLGREIYSGDLYNSLRVDLSTFSNGVYFIELSNGIEIVTERLILNR
ncbi:MAG: T9SS type A sorting domain-containing protein [Flavobacteriales bacterium]|nr:T9SS type A sorting domain-containing protein [Flavobacteriales bacterium]